jgi:hypothetical protein
MSEPFNVTESGVWTVPHGVTGAVVTVWCYPTIIDIPPWTAVLDIVVPEGESVQIKWLR